MTKSIKPEDFLPKVAFCRVSDVMSDGHAGLLGKNPDTKLYTQEDVLRAIVTAYNAGIQDYIDQ